MVNIDGINAAMNAANAITFQQFSTMKLPSTLNSAYYSSRSINNHNRLPNFNSNLRTRQDSSINTSNHPPYPTTMSHHPKYYRIHQPMHHNNPCSTCSNHMDNSNMAEEEL